MCFLFSVHVLGDQEIGPLATWIALWSSHGTRFTLLCGVVGPGKVGKASAFFTAKIYTQWCHSSRLWCKTWARFLTRSEVCSRSGEHSSSWLYQFLFLWGVPPIFILQYLHHQPWSPRGSPFGDIPTYSTWRSRCFNRSPKFRCTNMDEQCIKTNSVETFRFCLEMIQKVPKSKLFPMKLASNWEKGFSHIATELLFSLPLLKPLEPMFVSDSFEKKQPAPRNIQSININNIYNTYIYIYKSYAEAMVYFGQFLPANH